jgi:hypothetical protein
VGMQQLLAAVPVEVLLESSRPSEFEVFHKDMSLFL